MLVLCEPYLCPALRHHGCSRCQAGLRASRKAPPQALAPFVSSAVSAGRPQGEAWPLSFDGTGLTAAALKGIAEELPEQIALLKQLPKDITGTETWPTGTAELLSTEEPPAASSCRPGRLGALLGVGGRGPPRAPRIEAPSSFLVSSREVPGRLTPGTN